MQDIQTLPSSSIRPGVNFPDWSAVKTPQARDAVLAIMGVFHAKECWRNYTAEDDLVRAGILHHFHRTGSAPDADDLARSSGLPAGDIDGTLQRLRERDLVVMNDAGRVVGAYPLTSQPTEHRVQLSRHTVYAMCAIDALGTGAMFGEDVTITSTCRHCGTLIGAATRKQGRQLDRVTPDTAVVWSSLRIDGVCAADSLCTVIAFFCCDAHLDAWRRQHHPNTQGFHLTPDEAFQAGIALFAPTLRGTRTRAPESKP